MKLIIKTFNLKLKHPFSLSRGTRTEIPSLIVELRSNGLSGFGEATANPYYKTTVDNFVKQLQHKKSIIEINVNKTPEEFWAYLYPHFKNNLFLLCALDVAYYDLYTRIQKIPLYKYWGLSTTSIPLSNYTIGIDTIKNMLLKMKEQPSPIYKIKLGTKNDIQIVEELRKQTNSIFRIDANCGWTAKETIENSIALKKLGVEFIEQPLPADDWLGSKEIFNKSHLPIIADESCILENSIEKCANYFHGVNIKVMKCGGLTPAKRMISKAKELGLKTMVGCMTESSVGISAIAHLTPLLDYADLDGALLLKNNPAKGVKIKNGELIFNNSTGTGANLK